MVYKHTKDKKITIGPVTDDDLDRILDDILPSPRITPNVTPNVTPRDNIIDDKKD